MTFVNQPDNAMRLAIDGVRQNLDYAGIRKVMEANKDFKEGRANKFIFPDEDIYKREIGDALKTPIEIDTRLFVEKNGAQVPYSIEENH